MVFLMNSKGFLAHFNGSFELEFHLALGHQLAFISLMDLLWYSLEHDLKGFCFLIFFGIKC